MGASIGAWLFRDVLLVENERAGVLQHARSLNEIERIRYERTVIVSSPTGFLEGEVNSTFDGNPPVLTSAATFRDVALEIDDSPNPRRTFEVQA